jgi:hypothetical protein
MHEQLAYEKPFPSLCEQNLCGEYSKHCENLYSVFERKSVRRCELSCWQPLDHNNGLMIKPSPSLCEQNLRGECPKHCEIPLQCLRESFDWLTLHWLTKQCEFVVAPPPPLVEKDESTAATNVALTERCLMKDKNDDYLWLHFYKNKQNWLKNNKNALLIGWWSVEQRFSRKAEKKAYMRHIRYKCLKWQH